MALKKPVDSPEIKQILVKFERALARFASKAAGPTTYFLNDSRISSLKLRSALRKLAAATDALQTLNAMEEGVFAQLVHYLLNPCLAGAGTSIGTVHGALATLSKLRPTSAQIKNLKSIVESRRGRTKNESFTYLAQETLKIWQEAGLSTDRSRKRGGVVHLTELLTSCFEFDVRAFKKFDASGRPIEHRDQVGELIEKTGSVAKTLPKYVDQVVHERKSGERGVVKKSGQKSNRISH